MITNNGIPAWPVYDKPAHDFAKELYSRPLVGKAIRFLMEIRMTEGEIGKDRASQELRRWAAAEGISPPADG